MDDIKKIIDSIDFHKGSGMVPTIIQDYESNKVLMLAYMNRESLRKTLETNTTWFYSRTRNKLWNKGETSGHFQHVVEVFIDCDSDTLLIKVRQEGVVCHTGKESCFYKRIR